MPPRSSTPKKRGGGRADRPISGPPKTIRPRPIIRGVSETAFRTARSGRVRGAGGAAGRRYHRWLGRVERALRAVEVEFGEACECRLCTLGMMLVRTRGGCAVTFPLPPVRGGVVEEETFVVRAREELGIEEGPRVVRRRGRR